MRSNWLKYSFFALIIALLGCEGEMASDASTGQGGSMTRFAINNGFMYVVDNSAIQVFDVQNGVFTKVNTVDAFFGLETITVNGSYLYLGARDAMYIYSISSPAAPAFVFRYQHIVSCDPVVVQGNRAYVTLSSGSMCNEGVNALEIIDITDPMNPALVKNYPMTSPLGLAVDGNLLFICEADAGLKLWDISNELAIKELKHLNQFYAYDVIARGGLATVTGEDGIFQYAYSSDGATLQLLSKLEVTRAEP